MPSFDQTVVPVQLVLKYARMDKIDLLDDQRGLPDVPDLEQQGIRFVKEPNFVMPCGAFRHHNDNISVPLMTHKTGLTLFQGCIPFV